MLEYIKKNNKLKIKVVPIALDKYEYLIIIYCQYATFIFKTYKLPNFSH